MALNKRCRNREAGLFLPARVAPRLRTASPAEADGSFFREGPSPRWATAGKDVNVGPDHTGRDSKLAGHGT